MATLHRVHTSQSHFHSLVVERSGPGPTATTVSGERRRQTASETEGAGIYRSRALARAGVRELDTSVQVEAGISPRREFSPSAVGGPAGLRFYQPAGPEREFPARVGTAPAE